MHPLWGVRCAPVVAAAAAAAAAVDGGGSRHPRGDRR